MLVALLAGAGCASVPRHPDTAERLAGFVAYSADPRVRHEPGAEAFAARAAALLPGAIAQVEVWHRRPFARAVEIHVCGSPDCLARIVPDPPGITAAVAYDNRLLLGARLFDREPERLRPILVHELSHLHFGQRLGHYTPRIPVWFHEGFASLVAHGGGADLATDDEVATAIAAGRHFTVADGAGERAAGAGPAPLDALPMRLFYRQAYRFVRALARDAPHRFAALIDALQDGEAFEPAFHEAYGDSPATLYEAFLAAQRARAGVQPGSSP